MVDEADIILIGVFTLIIAVGVAVCMSPATPSGAGARGGGGASARTNNTGRGTAAAGSAAATRRSGPPSTPIKALSARALALQKEFNLPYGSPVTLTTNQALIEWPLGGGRGSPKLLPEAVETLKTFLEIADVFLINEVDSDAAETQILSTLKANGLVKEVKGNVDGSSPSSAVGGEGIPEHKILYCSTSIGKQAIVRQIRPSLHIDFDSELMQKLVPHVPRLVLVDPRFQGRADSVPYRVSSTLAALIPPATAVAGAGGS